MRWLHVASALQCRSAAKGDLFPLNFLRFLAALMRWLRLSGESRVVGLLEFGWPGVADA